MRTTNGVFLGGVAIVAAVGWSGAANAQTAAVRDYDLPAQSVASAIQAIARISGQNVAADAGLIQGRHAEAVKGRLSVEEALDRALAGTGLRAVKAAGGFVVRPLDAADGTQADSAPSGDIVVTGTRLRGANVASTVVTVRRSEIVNAGQANLGEFARSLPQSFGGGQNPGVGFNVPASSGINVGSAASFNLRGLGSDATLTLLNGRRLPYSSSAQSIDVSAIPLLAIDRVEIVPDGASALYGSDAVAGVVNLILRDKFDGLETAMRLGGSTDGGNFQQQYSAIAGTTWRSGRGFVAYEYEDDSAIFGRQRDYASTQRGLTLMPPLRSHRVIASAHQALFDGLTFAIDGLYNHRASGLLYALNTAGDLSVSRTNQTFAVETYALSPSLTAAIGPWNITLAGSYGKDVTRYRGDTYSGVTLASTAQGRYDNRSRSLELGATGPLFNLPGGPVRLAAGAGLRINDFSLFRGTGVISNIDASQHSRFVYGELGVPLVSPAMSVPLIYRVEVNAAFRHEDYRGIGGVTTPKLGLIYAPTPDFDVKASWGRSFRAPTFIQQYQVRQAVLYPTTLITTKVYPAGSNALILFGGNRELEPERATSWSATLALHPRSLAGLNLDLSYFSTRYVDRIVGPVPFVSLALTSPLYADYVTASPSAATQSALLASVDQFLNITGAAYDPATVVAVINTANVNAGRQTIRGMDAILRYTSRLGGRDTLSVVGDVSYLDSDQQLTPAQPTQPLSGQLFNPPHWRARGSVTWSRDSFGATATLSRIGGVTDPRSTPARAVRGMTLFDLSARYAFPAARGPLRGLEIAVAGQNIFNAKPAVIATTQVTDTPYDSTNYSSTGRVLSFRLSKRW